MTTTVDEPTTADLNRIIAYIGQPISPEFTYNRWPQDVPMLIRYVLQTRRRDAELLRSLHELPLDDVTPDDTPLEIVQKAQTFWLEYQQGLWGERETARLKRAKERAEQAVESGKQREEALQDRIAGLERAFGESQRTAADLRGTIDEMTNSLAAATQRDAERANRVQVLESERVQLEQQFALEQRLQREALAAVESGWRDTAERISASLRAINDALSEHMGGR